MAIIGFTPQEAEFFGNVVEKMMRSKEARKMEKPKKEKKAPKMKRAELLKRVLIMLEMLYANLNDVEDSWIPPIVELETLLTELRKVVK